jgi:hypothetical protein
MRGQPSAGPVRCRRCGDVIGVYEPMIALVGGEPRRTSRAAAHERGGSEQECYHAACFADGEDERPGE